MLVIPFAWWIKNLRVGAGRCVRPRVSMRSWLVDLGMPGVGALCVALARWMHHVRAEVAGCYAKSADSQVRLGLPVAFPFSVGRPSPMVGLMMSERGYGFAIVDGARPASRRMCTGLQYLKADQSG